MNKEFKKYFDKKMKDNTNKYVVMYKAILVLGMILFFLILTYEFYNSFKGGAPKKIVEILEITAIMLPFPLYFVQRKIFGKENKTKVISKCKTKKDKIILKIYNITKVILLVGFGLWFFVAGFVNEILGLLKNWNEGKKICIYILFAIFFIFERASSYLDKRNIT